MRPETTSTPASRVSYTFRATNYNANPIVGKRFATVEDALAGLYRRGRELASSDLRDRFVLVRVEETAAPARRELVTTGDLSLFNEGPVVLFGTAAQKYFGNATGDTKPTYGATLEEAIVYKNQEAAISAIQYGGVNGPFGPNRVCVIREVPSETIVTETVLA